MPHALEKIRNLHLRKPMMVEFLFLVTLGVVGCRFRCELPLLAWGLLLHALLVRGATAHVAALSRPYHWTACSSLAWHFSDAVCSSVSFFVGAEPLHGVLT